MTNIKYEILNSKDGPNLIRFFGRFLMSPSGIDLSEFKKELAKIRQDVRDCRMVSAYQYGRLIGLAVYFIENGGQPNCT